MKRNFVLVTVSTLVLLTFTFVTTAEAHSLTRMALGTSSIGGTYYILGTGWANLMNKNVDGVEISSEATPGPITNMQSMKNGDMELGLVTTWLGGEGYRGIGWANGTKYENCLGVVPLYYSVLYIFAPKDSNINTIYDLQGKRIACGAPGSTSGDAVKALLSVLNIQPQSVTGLSSNGMCDALKDGTIDAAFGITGIPAAWLLDLETTKELKFISLANEDFAKIFEKYPFWGRAEVPANTYKNQNYNWPVLSFWNMLVADESVSENVIYDLTKATYDLHDDLVSIDPNAKSIVFENIDKMTMPLHPGALKYYREKGVKVPEWLILK